MATGKYFEPVTKMLRDAQSKFEECFFCAMDAIDPNWKNLDTDEISAMADPVFREARTALLSELGTQDVDSWIIILANSMAIDPPENW